MTVAPPWLIPWLIPAGWILLGFAIATLIYATIFSVRERRSGKLRPAPWAELAGPATLLPLAVATLLLAHQRDPLLILGMWVIFTLLIISSLIGTLRQRASENRQPRH